MSADALRFYDVPSADGTRLRAWTNDAEGPTVLLCNGLGTSPYTWPALLRPDCGVRVLSWNHRGVGGSDRPADPRRVDVAAFVEDAVAGVPGATFSSMGAPLQIPRFARRPIAVGIVGTLARTGWAVTPVTSRLPIGRRAANLVRHSGLMMPSAGLETVERAVAEFLTTPVEWYMHLARESARHDRVSLSQVQVPVVFVAGTFDVLASAKDMRTASRRIPGSRFVELRGSHFVQMEHPAAVHDELLAALRDLAGSTPASSDRAGSA